MAPAPDAYDATQAFEALRPRALGELSPYAACPARSLHDLGSAEWAQAVARV